MPTSPSAKTKQIFFENQLFWTAERIDAETARLEPWLYQTKWFDYRFLSPAKCTQLFVDAYMKEYQYRWGRTFGKKKQRYKKGTHHKGWQASPREFISFWRARQFADQYCMPYSFYLHHALEFAMRIGYNKVPRPNQLFSAKHGEIFGNAAVNAWIEHSSLPQYHMDNARGLPAQFDHQTWLIQLLKERFGRPASIEEVQSKRLLPPAVTYFEFGPFKLERASRYSSKPSAKPAALNEEDFRPGCFGVMHAHDPTSDECSSCVFAAGCKGMSDEIGNRFQKKYGTDDVIVARKREDGRERVRKHRERKRQNALASSS